MSYAVNLDVDLGDGIPTHSLMGRPQKMIHGAGFRRGGVGCGFGAVGNRTYRVWVGLRVEFKGLLSLRGAVIWRRVTVFVGAVLGAVGKGSLWEFYRGRYPLP